MKKEYITPEMSLLKVNCNDIIATSNFSVQRGRDPRDTYGADGGDAD